MQGTKSLENTEMIYLIWDFNNIHALNQASLKIKWVRFLIQGLLITFVHLGKNRSLSI